MDILLPTNSFYKLFLNHRAGAIDPERCEVSASASERAAFSSFLGKKRPKVRRIVPTYFLLELNQLRVQALISQYVT
ncbi:hypothetical protein Lal_00001824 [Lupinus albus]|nr:hypothetical protein Lal_00001824 [Lupinus albus]